MLANRAHLFVFMSNRAVPCTNNVSERHLRPSVIFRKVTNGFRCEWGAETYAAFRSVVSTAKANRRFGARYSPVRDISQTIRSRARWGGVSKYAYLSEMNSYIQLRRLIERCPPKFCSKGLVVVAS
jgi:transposase